MRRTFFILLATLAIAPRLRADEGMWVPMLIGKNIDDMRKNGFKLTAEDLYSINGSSLKDAIVLFGRGCTGELISEQGLLITNHHCGYGAIQALSSVDHDYLSNGFWAASKTDELPCNGLSVSFLVRMEDVTHRVLSEVPEGCPETMRQQLVQKAISSITEAAQAEGVGFRAQVKPLYYGNQYYLYLYQVFTDVRLVGTPPESIGRFGGDTDNWMWPRHTGDFSMFRIYANAQNEPADYSPSNVPYRPKRFLKISTQNLKEGDFTLVYGFPGSTQQFLTSEAVELLVNQSNQHKVGLRNMRLAIFERYMRQNDTIRIQYSSKYAGVENSWKRWIGESIGLNRLEAAAKKREQEAMFQSWANASPERSNRYGEVLPRLRTMYQQIAPLALVYDYRQEAVNAIEMMQLSSRLDQLVRKSLNPTTSLQELQQLQQRAKRSVRQFYKDYNFNIDLEVCAAMLSTYAAQIPPEYHPETLIKAAQRCRTPDEWMQLAVEMYSQSAFADTLGLMALVSNFDSTAARLLLNDPVYRLHHDFETLLGEKVLKHYFPMQDSINLLYRSYVAGLMELQHDKTFYPDANLTLRITYGKIRGFEPKDGVVYAPFTTLDGVAEKAAMREVHDYRAPKRLLELHQQRDYGKHAVNGTIPVAFTATNHTTGGNSGSPILNADGNLIGLNFDRCWESTMSDVMYDPNYCRNISLDIRYVLFIIDRFAQAGHLIDEMVIAN
ncbi:MAG: S46 family peptidase [Bacteroidales bacterium]|nr:S46 family peptidase [Bacteroidales bacterium]